MRVDDQSKETKKLNLLGSKFMAVDFLFRPPLSLLLWSNVVQPTSNTRES